MSQLTALLYISRSLVEGHFERSAIAAILETARRNNASDEITGVLMLDHGQFVQVLEGERPTVERRFAIIKGDRRHTDVAVIGQKPIATRRFAQWNMAYLNAAKARLALGGTTIEELRRVESLDAAGVIDAMAKLATPIWADVGD